LASQLGLSTDGTLDDLRKRVKEKWSTVEPYLPSQSAAKSFLLRTLVQQNMDPSMHQGNCLSKIKIKLLTDLISGIPVLSGTDPEEILKFLIRAKGVFDLKLISESEFMVLLISRTVGRITQILGAHLGSAQRWAMVQSEIISTFLSPRVKEGFLAFNLRGRSKHLCYVSSGGCRDFGLHWLGISTSGPHGAKPTSEGKPEFVRDLFSLATTVAEAVAVEEQRKRVSAAVKPGPGPRLLRVMWH
jgi:hypothetical protein